MKEFHAPPRVLLGPGPSDADPRVLLAMAQPLVGHLDPAFLHLMDDVQGLLRHVFETENRLTIPISATGSAGMEAALVNLIEPGDQVVVGVNGVFGGRMCEIVERAGGELVRVDAEWGATFSLDRLREALQKAQPKILALVHAETSTGVLTPLEPIRELLKDFPETLLVLDCVTSLGGMPVGVDRHGVDAAYSGTQKCLSAPPGLSPVTFSERAVEAIRRRKTKVQSWYLDLSMVERYWGAERSYHHTAPISMNYALREALRIVAEEGLEARWARHRRNHEALVAGVEAMGLEMLVAPEHRLWTLNAVRVPEGVADADVRQALLEGYGIEIGGGLGPLKGQVWRIGLMGSSSTRRNVLLLLGALESILAGAGHDVPRGAAAEAALHAYEGAVAA